MDDNFLIDITKIGNTFYANYSNGDTIQLNANTYHDAVLEEDQLNGAKYELGYN